MRRKRLGVFWLAVLLSLTVGCSGKSSDQKKEPKKDEDEGLHGGKLFAPKGQHTYHLELTQAKDKPAYLYVLNDKANKHVPITAKTIEMEYKGDKPQKIEFKAESQEGDPKDESSRFTAPAGKIPDKLDLSKVEIHAEIKGKQYHFVEDKD
ncbi:MAG: hypothetical protein HYS12_11345 [Planctomycetes bacterium]|nr:hypothetical protein [Planctomycetota bacterium]